MQWISLTFRLNRTAFQTGNIQQGREHTFCTMQGTIQLLQGFTVFIGLNTLL